MSTHATSRLRRLATAMTAGLAALSLTFGIASAAYAGPRGIDVSRWQHSTPIDWQAVRADDVSFAFIKATEGVGYVNPYFESDWDQAKANGIFRGAYHFARPDSRAGDAASEARYFVANAGTHQDVGDLPPVLDLEDSGGLSRTALQQWVATFLETTEELTGRTPIIYASPAFWESNVGNSTAFTRYPLWIAHYGVSAPRVPGGWSTWTFWQSTSTARIAGISGNVDLNAFNGTRRQLKALANAEATPPEPLDPLDPEDFAPDTEEEQVIVATLQAKRPVIRRGARVRLYGSLATDQGAAITDMTVEIHQKRPGTKEWRLTKTVQTSGPDGSHKLFVAPKRTKVYKAVFPGGDAFGPTTSARVKVFVRR